MTLSLTNAILSLHPDARFGTDFVVAQTLDLKTDTIGPEEITFWNEDTLGTRDDAAIAKAQAADPAQAVPVSVTSAQAKIQLLRTPGSADGKTLLDDVKAGVDAAGGEVQIWFTDARTWERSNPYVAQLGKSLKLKAADIDALFVAAAQIAA